ncbi:MAG: tripartite tricarboxylate transporter substrate binding protein BugD [Hyphomicrobiales bacterium]|nr:tripartite tricarboxylate transporter substrate binding protein BugD [Hyphomicrobiales bacterium]
MKAVLIALGCMVATCPAASAQTYPTRPITMVVPFPAGGSSDSIGRIMAQGMQSTLGQNIIIENISGAAGNIAVGRVARAAPDGYTIVMGSWPTHVLNAVIYNLNYDPLTDFEPVSLVAAQPLFVIARKTMPASNLTEFLAWLKANPDKATMASVGASQIAGVLFQQTSGARFQPVPYRGAAPAMQDLLAGQIDMMIDLAASSTPHIRAGSVKAYAVTSKNRTAAAPDVPTVDEAGLPGFYVLSWHAIWVPKSTPKDVIAKLNAAAVAALADPTVRKRLADIGQEIYPREQQTPEATGAYQKAEADRWWPIIKAANIKAE